MALFSSFKGNEFSYLKTSRRHICERTQVKDTSVKGHKKKTHLSNNAMEDIRQKPHPFEVKRVWDLVMRDPHLKRLGDWLVKEEEKTKTEKWELERKFLKSPWICDLKVILVESPDYDSNIMVPFVEIWNNKEKSHANCAFAKLLTGQQQVGFKGIYWHFHLFFEILLIKKLLLKFSEVFASFFKDEIEVIVKC